MDPRSIQKNHHTYLAQAAIRDVLRADGKLRFAVISNSMKPLLRKGDWVIVKMVPVEDIHLGDLVLVSAEERLISHRVIRIDRDTIQTKGDAVPCADTPVSMSQMLGVIQTIDRSGKVISLATSSNRLIFSLVSWISKVEDHLWQFLHKGYHPENLRKKMDVINWWLRLPLRMVTLLANYLVWIKFL
jgi:signal peptidase I